MEVSVWSYCAAPSCADSFNKDFLCESGSLPEDEVYTYKQNALTRQKVQPMHHSSVTGVEDMATLQDLHDGAIMHNLLLRYQQRHIYSLAPVIVTSCAVYWWPHSSPESLTCSVSLYCPSF
ncbi:unnamed protein product [Pleuronectes platessa]|uniref:Uncharacterized protein n=1 Tax=Pleuronectes platessa TaxID=8262 RepID=A0A9N7VBL2_PLEPL|nr:unnamed protein product [Pleuronectes platessa]